MRVFVTGASGLVGSHLAELLRARGHEVRALQRRSSRTGPLVRLGCELVEGDVRDAPEALAAGMAGCTHLVHAAAVVYGGGPWPKVRAVNVEGTRHVMEAAARAGVGHAIHVSSVAVYGNRPGPIDEDVPLDTPLDPRDLYGRSKREAEAEARAVETEYGLGVSVVRPSAVYGERDRLLAPTIARVVRRRVAPMLGRGDNTVPVVYAGNLALALLLALEAERKGATWNLGIDRPLTQRALMEGIARGLGLSPRLVPIPAPVVRAGAGLFQMLRIPVPGAEEVSIERVVRNGLGENPYASERIRQDLGWDPPYPHDEALERTGRWLKETPVTEAA